MFENEVQNLGIIDSGCPDACGGKPFITQLETSNGTTYESKEIEEFYKFGNNVYKARYAKTIPVPLGDEVKMVSVAVVDAHVPLLISGKNLKDWKAVIDFHKEELILKDSDTTVKLKKTHSGHLTIPLAKNCEVDEKELVNEVLLVKKDLKQLGYKEVKKLHRVFGHPREDKVKIILKSQPLWIEYQSLGYLGDHIFGLHKTLYFV